MCVGLGVGDSVGFDVGAGVGSLVGDEVVAQSAAHSRKAGDAIEQSLSYGPSYAQPTLSQVFII